MSWSKW